MERLNREWHEAHRMPDHATVEQRIEWHLEHHRVCGCAPIPPKLREEMARRGLLPDDEG